MQEDKDEEGGADTTRGGGGGAVTAAGDGPAALTQAELSSLPETIKLFSFNRSFQGVLYLRQYLAVRGRYKRSWGGGGGPGF